MLNSKQELRYEGPHRKINVWNEEVGFVVDVYQAMRSFLKTEQYALADQLRRAAVSIPSNIAEGAGGRRERILSNSCILLTP